ncbi:hypothetical protein SDC9_96191 [bioreactor metagenome]|uniref:Uncharacterized protein n=1 Tax=bioreactor metagenome TaxID=1076179 RepID=A0A645AAZ4_9ZZZZ
MPFERCVHERMKRRAVAVQQLRALGKRQPHGTVSAVVGVVTGGLVAEKVDRKLPRNSRFQQIYDVAVIGNRNAPARTLCMQRERKHLVQIVRNHLHPTLIEPGLNTGAVHFRKHANRAGDVRGLGLRAAHAAEAGTHEHLARQIPVRRHAKVLSAHAENRVERAVDDSLRADVHPAARGHLPVVGNAHLLGNLPVIEVIEHADHQRVGQNNARGFRPAREQSQRMAGLEHQRLLVGQFFEVTLDEAVLQPVLAGLPGFAVGDQFVGVERDLKVQIVVDHHLERLARKALTLVLVDGLAVNTPLGTVAIGVDAAARFQLFQELRRKRFVQTLRHVPQRVFERLPRLREGQPVAAIRRTANVRLKFRHLRQCVRQRNFDCSRSVFSAHMHSPPFFN